MYLEEFIYDNDDDYVMQVIPEEDEEESDYKINYRFGCHEFCRGCHYCLMTEF